MKNILCFQEIFIINISYFSLQMRTINCFTMQIEQPRNERFISPITIKKSSSNFSGVAENPYILKYAYQEKENIHRLAIDGLISYGRKNSCEQQAGQLANLLEKAIAQKNQKAIGDTAFHLYTKECFLYKDIRKYFQDSQFQSPHFTQNATENYSKIYDLLPFCFILNDHIKQRARREKFRGTVYRSCNLNQEQINQYIDKLGENRQWNDFTSTTKNRKKAQHFGNVLFLIKLGQSQQRWGFHYGLQIQKYSAFPSEQQVLLFAGMQIMTQKVVKAINKYLITIICVDVGE